MRFGLLLLTGCTPAFSSTTAAPAARVAPDDFSGAGPGFRFGAALAVADLNGDGYDDLAIGAPNADSGAGQVVILHGSAAGLVAVTTLTGIDPDDAFGAAVASAGDVDGDGYDDLVVGAPRYGGELELGAVSVFHGSAAGLSGTPRVTWIGDEAGANLGASVAGAGDVDGDGHDDVVAGSPGNASAYLYSGSPGGLPPVPDHTWTGEAGSRFGHAVAGVGDLDADGLDDVAIGAPAFEIDVGKISVYAGAGAIATAVYEGRGPGDQLGWALARAGDADGDGIDDLVGVARAPEWAIVYTWLGGAAGPADAPIDTFIEAYGFALAGAGDLDGDGDDELLVGAFGREGKTGRASIYAGYEDGYESFPLRILKGDARGDRFGEAVAAGGDFDGDGRQDFAVGAPGAAGVGRVRVFAGR